MIAVLGANRLGSFVLGKTSILQMVTDRTEADVARLEHLSSLGYHGMTAEERLEWELDHKGAYNNTDLNRVEAAVAYLAEKLRELPAELMDYAENEGVAWDLFFAPPYFVEDLYLQTKLDWAKADVQTPASMERYLSNVVAIRKALASAAIELPKSMDYFTWNSANAIERALLDTEEALVLFRARKKEQIDNAAAASFYSGEIFTGEV